MRRTSLVPVVLAVIGLSAVLVGARLEIVTLRPVYEGPIRSVGAGVGAKVGHQEQSLIALTGVGVLCALVGAWWRAAAYLTQVVGAVVLAFAFTVLVDQVTRFDLYSGVPLFDGASGHVLLGGAVGAFLIGGLALVSAGVVAANLAGGSTGRRGTAGRVP
jgi:hypothetical protein